MSTPPAGLCRNQNKLTFPILTLLKTAKRKPTRKGQASNAEVFRAAARLMVQKGYGATSISDIAKAVGMTKAGLYHHITGKQDLLFQILIHAMDGVERDVIEPVKQVEDPEERLREIIRLHLHRLFENGLEFALLFPERRHLEPVQQEAVVQRAKIYLSLIGAAMRELADQGKLQDLDIDIAAVHILQTISGIARWYTKDTGVSEDHLVEQTVKFNMSAILK
ncbi:MAG: TetR/AcrR family transcriptional regulator [Opitutales bacterium]|jgi:TetR/AcrR family transcriptional regulator, cholesterol catabolism regulator|nr:TetR/AcrR family transcriptional regulator [Opitutales bacterium]